MKSFSEKRLIRKVRRALGGHERKVGYWTLMSVAATHRGDHPVLDVVMREVRRRHLAGYADAISKMKRTRFETTNCIVTPKQLKADIQRLYTFDALTRIEVEEADLPYAVPALVYGMQLGLVNLPHKVVGLDFAEAFFAVDGYPTCAWVAWRWTPHMVRVFDIRTGAWEPHRHEWNLHVNVDCHTCLWAEQERCPEFRHSRRPPTNMEGRLRMLEMRGNCGSYEGVRR